MFRLTSESLVAAELARALDNPAFGACVSFEGRVRDHNRGRPVLRLEYQAYPALAVKEGERILREVRERFQVEVIGVHRFGMLELGDVAVWVGAASPHRRAAFAACAQAMDEIKRRLPIWKREQYADGEAEWVHCAACHTYPAEAWTPR